MLWLIFAILAALVWALVDIVDKFTLSSWLKKPIIPLTILTVVSSVIGILLFIVRGFPLFSVKNILLAFIAGIVYVVVSFFYFKSVQIEEISRVIPLLYITPVFVAILAAVFLGEIFNILTYVGIILIILGADLIASQNILKLKFRKAFWFMLIASFALAVNMVIIKYLLNFANFWTVFSFERIGAIFTLPFLLWFCYPNLIYDIKNKGKQLGVVSFNQGLNFLGVLFITIAMSFGFVTLVDTLSSFQPFFVLIFTVLLSLFKPKILKEEINKRTITLKIIAIILLFIGTFLII